MRVPQEGVPCVRHGDRQHASRADDPVQLAQCLAVVLEVLQHLGHEHLVDRPIAQAACGGCRPWMSVASNVFRTRPLTGARRSPSSPSSSSSPQPGHRHQVEAHAAAAVEHAVAVPQLEIVEQDARPAPVGHVGLVAQHDVEHLLILPRSATSQLVRLVADSAPPPRLCGRCPPQTPPPSARADARSPSSAGCTPAFDCRHEAPVLVLRCIVSVRVEYLAHRFARVGAYSSGLLHHLHNALGQRPRVPARLHQPAEARITHDHSGAGDVAGHDGRAAQHRLDLGQARTCRCGSAARRHRTGRRNPPSAGGSSSSPRNVMCSLWASINGTAPLVRVSRTRCGARRRTRHAPPGSPPG